ncbi:DUF1559 family PulG-like putative transporter [Pirellulimonas nuda]|uniref:DUF1559 family PulG-like putative transporter n=1 Tax=Pirellulimonas nuda TaxID=2528009 RepID=UPI0018D34DB5|nr:DUF1559 domain-containing protein [Pirellulimonas nuda]
MNGYSRNNCPGSTFYGRCLNNTEIKYLGDGVFFYANRVELREITDGTSATMLAGETVHSDNEYQFNTWAWTNRYTSSVRTTTAPLNYPVNLTSGFVMWANNNTGTNGAFGSSHPGGAFFVFADGHVPFISEQIDQDLYEALSTRAGGEVIADSGI